jgi:F-type H+-transporting ATPase subunit epsilon
MPFTFELVTPERILVSEPVNEVRVPGADGDMTVMAGHAPVIANLRPGVVEAKAVDGSLRRVFVRAGFCEITADSLVVLAECASDMAEAGLVAAELKAAERDLASASDDEARWAANTAIAALNRVAG